MNTLTYDQFGAKLEDEKWRKAFQWKMRVSVIRDMMEMFKISTARLTQLQDMNIDITCCVGAVIIRNAEQKLRRLLLKIK